MDELGEDARLYGAVNTVCIRGKRCIGHNTDGMGFYQALTDLGVEVPGRRITLLGAGGAAKAVALKLVQQGAGPHHRVQPDPPEGGGPVQSGKGPDGAHRFRP